MRSIRSLLMLALLSIAALVAVEGVVSWQIHKRVQAQLELLDQSSVNELSIASELLWLVQNTLFTMMHAAIPARSTPFRATAENLSKKAKTEAAAIALDLEKTEASFVQLTQATDLAVRLAGIAGIEEIEESERQELEELIYPLEGALREHKARTNIFLDLLTKDADAAMPFLESSIVPHYRTEIQPRLLAVVADAKEEFTDETEKVHQALKAASTLGFGLTLGAFLLSLAIASLLARTIATPLKELTLGVKKLGAGEDIGRVQLQRKDELGVLAGAFNVMAENLREAGARLKQESDERRRAEQRASQRLQELARVNRLSTMNEMAAGLAHELNQPLGAVTTYTRAAVRMLEDGSTDTAEITGVMSKAVTQSKRAAQIIGRLRQFVDQNAKTVSICDVSVAVSDVSEMLRHEAELADVEFLLAEGKDPPQVLVDRIQLEQVLLNLMRNCIEAMSGEQAPRLLSIDYRCIGMEALEIRLRDTGPGVATSDLEAIFEPFASRKDSGMGMGLSISRSIVESHGGRLHAEPNTDGGLVFVFSLPLAEIETPTRSNVL